MTTTSKKISIKSKINRNSRYSTSDINNIRKYCPNRWGKTIAEYLQALEPPTHNAEPTTPKPEHQKKIRSSIENIPIELKNATIRTFLSQYATQYPTPAGKTPHRGERHENTYLITGTRIHYRTNIKQHPQNTCKFGRRFRIT